MGAQLSRGKSQEEVYRYREAELTHGRIGMLASAGFLVQEGYHPLFEGTGETYSQQLQDVPGWFWLPLVLVFGAIETKRGTRSKDPSEGYYPGDFGWDPLGLKPDDAEEFQRKQEIELNNGRLGMLASLGFIAQEAATGASWRDFWTPGVMAISPLHADMQNSDVPAVMAVRGRAGAKKKITNDTTFCYGLPGAMLPIGEFDPAGLSRGRSQAEMYRFREAELTHGRIGMLASAGFLVQEGYHPIFETTGETYSQ